MPVRLLSIPRGLPAASELALGHACGRIDAISRSRWKKWFTRRSRRGRVRNEIRIGTRYYSESRRLRSSQNKEPDRSRWSLVRPVGWPVGKDPPPPPPPFLPRPPPPPPSSPFPPLLLPLLLLVSPPPPSSINRMPDNEGISPRESPPVTFTFYATLWIRPRRAAPHLLFLHFFLLRRRALISTCGRYFFIDALSCNGDKDVVALSSRLPNRTSNVSDYRASLQSRNVGSFFTISFI